MTREKIKELAPIMSAFADEKKIEWKPVHGPLWLEVTTANPNFEAGGIEWRIKTEPRTFYLVVPVSGAPILSMVFDEKVQAVTHAQFASSGPYRVYKVEGLPI